MIIDHDQGLTGSTKSLIYLLRELQKEPVEISIATRKGTENKRIFEGLAREIISLNDYVSLNFSQSSNLSFFKPIGLYSIFLTFVRFFKGINIANKLIKQTSPDLVLLNEYVLIQFAIAAKLKKIKTVTYIRSQFFKGKFGVWGKTIKKIIFKFSDKILVISKLELNQFKPYSESIRDKFLIVREFLDEQNFETDFDIKALRERYKIPEYDFVAVTLGGVKRIKGTYELLQAMKELKKTGKDIFCIIAGKVGDSGTEQKEYSKKCFEFIKKNSLDEVVRIIEEQSEVLGVISASDVLLSTNTTSHFSRPIIEAWAKKKPVVASDHPHTREIVIDEQNGLLYKSDDYFELSEKIKKLINDQELRKKLGETGFESALNIFSMDKNINNIKKFLLEK